jgi:SAM-dependent methyltransferase
MEDTSYALGTSQAETERLEFQSQLLQPATDRLLRIAGLRPGMRVLDIGTGTGEVAALASEIVGPSGYVLGIDHNGSILEQARRKHRRRLGSSQMEFQPMSFLDLDRSAVFDVVIGRFVLTFQPDPANFLREAAGHVGRGGTIAFLEPAACRTNTARSFPPVPLWDETVGRIVDAFRSGGTRPDQGFRLTEAFFQAGLPEPTLFCDPLMGSANTSQIIDWACMTMQSLLPIITRREGAPESDIPIEDLTQRLRNAASSAHSQLTFFSAVGAVTHVT